MKSYDVIVVGGGHAGCEAALASARTGSKTALITLKKAIIGCMPCNPSIGGIAKSHLVFELDALGGEMARNADYTGIQFKTLNTSRGPAVQSNRAQCDKRRYSDRMAAVIESTANLDVLEAKVLGIAFSNGALSGVLLDDGSPVHALAVVLTPGTALGGVIHIGDRHFTGGGNGEDSVSALGKAISELGFSMARLKTGTPPRLHRGTIDYGAMVIQPGDEPPPLLSVAGRRESQMFHVEQERLASGAEGMFHVEQGDRRLRPWDPGSAQVPCYLTHTTAATHEIIRANLRRSALYGGHISGTGVRYCPSVEDKVVKFPEKDQHHVFIEPEGRDSDLIYPNGISNSLPEDVQEELVHSVPGLEMSTIVRPGFAIEYDFSSPTQLFQTLESKVVENLYFAGQINGTTGYEEAAAQGFIAGVNAARNVQGRVPIEISRQEAYIGVMIDDLVTKGADEPYRMFTSRAERRLILRQDNARFRMLTLAKEIGIVPSHDIAETEAFDASVRCEMKRLASVLHGGVPLLILLRRPGTSYADLPDRERHLHPEVIRQVEILAKYEGYIRREETDAVKARASDLISIPPDFDYFSIKTLRRETQEKLTRVRPSNIGQASRIPGITPVDVSIIATLVKAMCIETYINK